MANVIVVLDEDPNRRAKFIREARSRIAPLPGLEISQFEGDGWAGVWATSPRSPVSVVADASGAAAVWGDAISASGHRLSATDVREAWHDDPLASWDGFHLALEVLGKGRLRASVDIMGLLPLYHWQGPDVVLVGTSVDTFRAHPSFQGELDTSGLVGIMLMNGQVGGRTLWKGVTRLDVRRQLQVRDGKISEVSNFTLPEPDPWILGLPFEGQVDVLGATVDESIRRQVRPDEPHGILLSGGLDSRQLGGFLVDQGVPLEALTFGLDGDIEMKCAKRIAQSLGVRHISAEVPSSSYLGAAECLLKVEGLAAGFSNVLDWGMIPFFERLPARIALGHVFDGVVGGIHIPWAYRTETGKFSFETIFNRFNRWGFTPETLRELLVPELHASIDPVVEQAREIYESASPHPNLKAWHFDLLTRQRFHVGAAVWPTTFRAWPMSPIFDREVFRVSACMPASSISDRRLQRELLVARHPKLAAISLDRNSFNTLPVLPTMGDRIRVAVSEKWHRLSNKRPFRRLGNDSRFYYRTYDFDSPGWIDIRRSAEPHRNRIPAVLRREVVDRLLPGPDQHLRTNDGIIDSANAKLLVGLALAGKHFGLG